jgi:hypothetical protein
MNRGEGDDSIAPIGEVIGWIVLKLWTDNYWNYDHVLLPWIDYRYCNILLLSADKRMNWYVWGERGDYNDTTFGACNDTTFILIGQLRWRGMAGGTSQRIRRD